MSKKDAIALAMETHKLVSQDLTSTAVRTFMSSLGENPCPTSDEMQSALTTTRIQLVDKLFGGEIIKRLFDGDAVDEKRLATVRLRFDLLVPRINCPPLPVFSEVPPLRLALAAMIGAVIGVLIGSPVGIYLLGTRDTGLILGAPLGAFLITWAVDDKFLSLASKLVVGFATVAEARAVLAINPLAAIREGLIGRAPITKLAVTGLARFVRRIVVLLLIPVLYFARRRATFDRSVLEQSLHQVIDQWLIGALILIVVEHERMDDRVAGGQLEAKAISELGRRIIELHSASSDTLPGLAEDVIESARAAGFEGLDGPVGFSVNSDGHGDHFLKWDESLREKFNTFGHVELGDDVRIDQEPVVRNGEVLEKGLVRKKRGG